MANTRMPIVKSATTTAMIPRPTSNASEIAPFKPASRPRAKATRMHGALDPQWARAKPSGDEPTAMMRGSRARDDVRTRRREAGAWPGPLTHCSPRLRTPHRADVVTWGWTLASEPHEATRCRRRPFSAPRRPLVLCYHAVSETWTDRLAVTPVALEHQIRYLMRRGHVSASADEILGGGGRCFHVTFDDGFKNILAALDILSALEISATIFAVSGFADEGRPFDVGRVGRLPRTPEELDAGRRTMTWDELRAVAERGFEIGSHTVSHPHLTQLSDHELNEELRRSREQIEDGLRSSMPPPGVPVRRLRREGGACGGSSRLQRRIRARVSAQACEQVRNPPGRSLPDRRPSQGGAEDVPDRPAGDLGPRRASRGANRPALTVSSRRGPLRRPGGQAAELRGAVPTRAARGRRTDRGRAAGSGADPPPRLFEAAHGWTRRDTPRRCGSAGSGRSSGSAGRRARPDLVAVRPVGKQRDGEVVRGTSRGRRAAANGDSNPVDAVEALRRSASARRARLAFAAGRRPSWTRAERRPHLVEPVVEPGHDARRSVLACRDGDPRSASSCRASGGGASAAASSSSSVTIMPPSPIGRFLFEKKLKQPSVAERPAGPPADGAPGACAASSITMRPCALGDLRTASMSHGKPP